MTVVLCTEATWLLSCVRRQRSCCLVCGGNVAVVLCAEAT